MNNGRRQFSFGYSNSISKILLVLLLGIIFSIHEASAASGLFPKMPAAPKVYVVDCRNDSAEARTSAWALQGLVNQTSAEVYIIEKEKERHMEQLKDCGKPFELLEPLTGNNSGLRTLFKKYQDRVKRMVIYDPKKDWTCYLALMSVAQQGGIPVSETVMNDLISEFHWQGKIEDFRSRFPKQMEAYDWALANLMPGCNKQVVFAVWDQAPLVDYVVASKGFAFGMDFNGDRAEVEKIFRAGGYGVGTSLMGYANTGDDANKVANPFGFGYVASDLYANCSFWSSFPDKTYKQTAGKAIKVEKGKIYASIMWSDGDNIQFDQNALWNLWHDPARGTIPVATALSPTLQELDSPLLDWYYTKKSDNDELMCGPTGVQFIYIEDFKDELLPAWCKLTREWCADAGFHTVRIWRAPYMSQNYIAFMTTCGFDGVLGERGAIQAGFPPKIDTHGVWSEEELYQQFAAVKPNSRAPVFASFTPIVEGFTKDGMNAYTKIKRQIDRLEAAYPGRYVFLLPKDQFATIQAYYNLPASP
jgi:hypothetical protein